MVATPVVTHFEIARAALSLGKHVLVEKPLARSLDQAQRLAKLAASTGRTLMAGHTFLYSAPVLHLRKLIDDGHLGDVRYAYAQRLNLGKIRTDCDALWNFAPHDLSILEFLMKESPIEVSAIRHCFLETPSQIHTSRT